mmetsp:Transcript_27361/g.82445  ORF Transcript_27361/g.82445 Transcript_27361/m.82445 type:complete len:212 (-) Transcript_27361:97-732(-)
MGAQAFRALAADALARKARRGPESGVRPRGRGGGIPVELRERSGARRVLHSRRRPEGAPPRGRGLTLRLRLVRARLAAPVARHRQEDARVNLQWRRGHVRPLQRQRGARHGPRVGQHHGGRGLAALVPRVGRLEQLRAGGLRDDLLRVRQGLRIEGPGLRLPHDSPRGPHGPDVPAGGGAHVRLELRLGLGVLSRGPLKGRGAATPRPPRG